MGSSSNSASETLSGLPEEYRPYVDKALGAGIGSWEAGAFDHVEGLTPEQLDAFERKKELGARGGVLDQLGADSYGAAGAYRDAASGTGLFGADAFGKQVTALEDTIGEAQTKQLGGLNTGASLGGTLGSARQSAATERALSDTAGQIAQNELSARRQGSLQGAQGVIGSGTQIGNQLSAGIAATEGVGSAIQQQKQNEGDAQYQGVQRLFGLLGSPALGQQQNQVQSQKTK